MEFSDALELEIRRWYSGHFPGMRALRAWVENSLAEMTRHDRYIYSFKTRIKTVDSVLGKLEKKVDKFPPHSTAESILDKIEDFVGARILVFHPTKMLRMNEMLLNDFGRIQISSITLHSHKNDRNLPYLKKIVEDCEHPCEIILNNTGYSSFHYVLHPRFQDNFYSDSYRDSEGIKLYPKFELQVRTIIQETWSEVQHKLIYKTHGHRSTYAKSLGQQFEQLAQMLNVCDNILDKLNEPVPFAPSKHLREDEVRPEFGNLMSILHHSLTRFENEGIPIAERYQPAHTLLEKNNAEIAGFTGKITENTININLELSEYYLKTGHYQEAFTLFSRIEKFSTEDPWVFLRGAETCLNYEGYFEEGKDYVHKLFKNVIKRDDWRNNSDHMDDVLYHHGAMIASSYNLLNIANALATRAVELTPPDDLGKWVNRKLNLISYSLQQWESYYNPDDSLDVPSGKLLEFKDLLVGEKVEVQRCIDILEHEQSMGEPADWDTLGRYYHWLAYVELKTKGPEMLTSINRASHFMDRCFSLCSNKQEKPDPQWYEHSNQIRSLQSHITKTL